VAVAASAAIAAGAATAVELAKERPPVLAQDVARGANAQTHVAATVDYMATPWHTTEMRVQVSGIQPGTPCDFWIVGPNGHAVWAGSWITTAPYGQKASYTVSSPVRASTVHSFQITSAGKVLVNIPAA
jgi:hypothetical protein